MTASGRDRDPAFGRRKAAASKPAPKKPATPKPQEPAAEASSSPKPDPKPPVSAEPKDTLTSPVTEPQVKIEPALDLEEDPKPKKKNSDTPPPVSKEGETSRRSKMIGVFVAIVFLIGISVLGYYVISSIMANDGGSGGHGTEEIAENSEDEGEAHAGAVSMDEGQDAMTEEGAGDEEGQELRNTELSEENSLEPEVNEASTSTPESSNENNEKTALSSVIRKKGEFEIPCWIVAFSANDKKPLANMNYSALEALGYDAGIYWIPKYFPSGKSMYKVYVGPYKSAEEAQAILPQIRNLQPDAYVMKIDE